MPKNKKANSSRETVFEEDMLTTEGKFIGRDLIQAGDINGSYVAMGSGAHVVVHNIQQGLSAIDELELEIQAAERRLAEAIQTTITRYTSLEKQVEAQSQNNPYKALDNYEINDAPFFFGRKQTIDEMLRNLDNNRLTILHAESGSGKTSLLKAGLASRLLADENFPLYLRPRKLPPHQAIKKAFLPDYDTLPELARFKDSQMSLRGYLERVIHYLGKQRLYIFLDQFEEFFTEVSFDQQQDFTKQLEECVESNLPVHWVLALRKEYFSDLRIFRSLKPFEHEYFLAAFDFDEAREVITKPAALKGIQFEKGLVNRILDDISQEEKRIQPVQIQLVCDTLYNELITDPDQKIITNSLYQKPRGHGEVPGAEGILKNHLSNVLNLFIGSNRKLADQLLMALVTSDMRRAIRSKDKLLEELQPKTPEDIESVLAILYDKRLVRREINEDGEIIFELTHDYLLAEIEIAPEIRARKAAAELLARELISWQDHKALLRAETLRVITAQQEHLLLDEPVIELLFCSALETGIEPEIWLSLISKENARLILLENIENSDSTIRGRALDLLIEVEPEKAKHILLADLETGGSRNRLEALHRLERLMDEEVMQALISELRRGQDEGMWHEVLRIVVGKKGASYRNGWQLLHELPQRRAVEVMSLLRSWGYEVPLSIRWRLWPAQIAFVLQREVRQRPLRFAAISVGVLSLLVGSFYWMGWWPFLRWDPIAGVPAPADGYRSLAVSESGMIYAGSFHYGLAVQVEEGDWEYWQDKNLPTGELGRLDDPESDTQSIVDLEPDPLDSNRIYALVFDHGVYAYEIEGNNNTAQEYKWAELGAGQVPTTMVDLAAENNVLLAAGSNGLYGSSDHGLKWQRLDDSETLSAGSFDVVIFQDGRPYAGGPSGLFLGLGEFPYSWELIPDIEAPLYLDSGPEGFIYAAIGPYGQAIYATCYHPGTGLDFLRDFTNNFDIITTLIGHPTKPGVFYVATLGGEVFELQCNQNLRRSLNQAPRTIGVTELDWLFPEDDNPILIQANTRGLYFRRP